MLSIDYRAEPILGWVSYSRNFTMCQHRWRCCWQYSDQLHPLFAWAIWNGQDPILKEPPFGVTGPEGNHKAANGMALPSWRTASDNELAERLPAAAH